MTEYYVLHFEYHGEMRKSNPIPSGDYGYALEYAKRVTTLKPLYSVKVKVKAL